MIIKLGQTFFGKKSIVAVDSQISLRFQIPRIEHVPNLAQILNLRYVH